MVRSHPAVNYHSSVCMRQHRRRPQRVVQHHYCGRQQQQQPYRFKFDPLSLYGGLHGLSFDPTNTQALLNAVNTLRSTQGRGRCITPPLVPSNPSSSSASDTSFPAATTPPPPCPAHESSGCQTPVDVVDQEVFLQERKLQENLLEKTSSFLQQHQQQEGCSSRKQNIPEPSQIGVGTSTLSSPTTKSRKRPKDLTWIDWGWPRNHVACPFNPQRWRTLEPDDSFVRPERICERPNYLEGVASICKLLARQLCFPACCCEKQVMASTPVDVMELAGSYVFIADMPGLKHTDVKVQVENDNVLRISGERRREDAVQDGEVKYVRVERSAGKFMRKFNLPANANLDAITAACQDGLLTIIVPKTPPPDIYRPRTFDVAVSSADLGKA